MAISGSCHCSMPGVSQPKSASLSSKAFVNLTRPHQHLTAKLATLRSSRSSVRSSHTVKCQQRIAPEASVTCLGEALFGERKSRLETDAQLHWNPDISSVCRLLGGRKRSPQGAGEDLDSIPWRCPSKRCRCSWQARGKGQLCQRSWPR